MTAQRQLELRFFGVALLGVGLWLWLGVVDTESGRAAAVVTAAAGAVGLAWPPVLAWPYRLWTTVTRPVAQVVGWLALVTVFFAVVVPLGFLLRLLGVVNMPVRPDAQAETYWVARSKRSSRERYGVPY